MESVKFWDVSERKQQKNKMGVNLSNTGGALKKIHLDHSRR